MPLRSALFGLFLCTLAVSGAELKTLDGTTITGELLSLNDKEAVIRSGADTITTPIEKVLTIDLAPAANRMPKDAKYKDVELIDGTLLHCEAVTYQGKQVKLTTLARQEVEVPLASVRYVVGDAHDSKVAGAFKEFLAKRRATDILVARGPDGQLNGLDGTLGDADDKGDTIDFTLANSDRKVQVSLTKVQGMIFVRKPADKVPICKIEDNYRNVVMVGSVTLAPAGLTVETPAGAKLTYAKDLVSRLDFSRGKLTFLSDLKPVKVVETSVLDRVEPHRRDQNLDGEKMRLDNVKYDKGLALHAHTELEYDLGGEYEFFQAVIGVDDLVGGSDGPTIVRLEGDGRELKSWTVSRKDKPLQVKVPLRDVRRLKIIVTSGDLLDLGKHVNLADAKVSK